MLFLYDLIILFIYLVIRQYSQRFSSSSVQDIQLEYTFQYDANNWIFLYRNKDLISQDSNTTSYWIGLLFEYKLISFVSPCSTYRKFFIPWNLCNSWERRDDLNVFIYKYYDNLNTRLIYVHVTSTNLCFVDQIRQTFALIAGHTSSITPPRVNK